LPININQSDNETVLPILGGPTKRKYAEIADSQSEEGLDGSDDDYGWGQDDDLATDQLLDHEVTALQRKLDES
jgi:hypothetical protein